MTYGAGYYGTMTGGSGAYDLLDAVVYNNHSVLLVFSADLNPGRPDVQDPASYTITGLSVVSATLVDTNAVLLQTATQVEGATYLVTVVPLIFLSLLGDSLNLRSDFFTGAGAADGFVVTNLTASTWCGGNRILLRWTNPAGTARVKVIRRTRSWPYDLTDDHDVVLDTTTVVDELMDGGADLTFPGELTAQTYYYYLVLVSPFATSPQYDIQDGSRTYGLSIEATDSANGFFWALTPKDAKRLDHLPPEEGGGNGFLRRIYSVLGCWLDLMRGHANAIRLLGDNDQAPYFALAAKNEEAGTFSEGDGYDWATARRQAIQQVPLYQTRGTCPGIVEAVRMFTLWESTCAEVGLSDGCHAGASSLSTWSGVGACQRMSTTIAASLTTTFITKEGKCVIFDPGALWEPKLWNEGRLYGPMGDIACIEESGDNWVTTKAPVPLTTVTATLSATDTTVTVGSTLGLHPGVSIQISGLSMGDPYAEIHDVVSVDSATQFTIRRPITATFDDFPTVSLGKSFVRWIYEVDSVLGTGATQITDAGAVLVDGQWVGYVIDLGDEIVHNITANTGTVVTFDPPYAGYPGAVSAVISSELTAGMDYLAHYRLESGEATHLFEPTADLELSGTRYDPYNRLWAGTGLPRVSAWGPNDLLIYITSSVPVTYGQASVVSGGTLTLDPSAPAPAVNELVGKYINPNQNQSQLFEIVSNTATTVTTSGNIESLVVAGEYYVILEPRDRTRYLRLMGRLNNEWSHSDVAVRILFV